MTMTDKEITNAYLPDHLKYPDRIGVAGHRVYQPGDFDDVIAEELSPEASEKLKEEWDQELEEHIEECHTSPEGGDTWTVISPTGGRKGQKPEQYSLIPTGPLAEVARVYGYGTKRYAPNNWRLGYNWTLSYDAAQRHMNAFWAGEDINAESGYHHLAHAAFHLFALMEYEMKGLGEDDRGDVQGASDEEG